MGHFENCVNKYTIFEWKKHLVLETLFHSELWNPFLVLLLNRFIMVDKPFNPSEPQLSDFSHGGH